MALGVPVQAMDAAALTGDQVATEVEAVAINSYRAVLKGKGFLRVLSNPIQQEGATA